ncbi:MAG: hypothetical protein JSU92_09040 [Deltaproteobacteria bacterium]|nr:MAG: hypothetical protein JSU92_09040 [Deltaproteobacteria bacterium]
MIGRILAALGSVLILAGPLSAEPFKSPLSITKERSVFQCGYEDPDVSFARKPLGIQALDRELAEEIEITVERYREGEQKYIRIHNNNKLRNGNKLDATTILIDRGELIWKSTTGVITNASGKELSRGSFYDPRDPAYGYPDDIYDPSVLLTLFRGMELEKDYQQYFHLWITSHNILRMKIRVEGTEEVKVPAGTFRCHQVVMTPMVSEFYGELIGKMVQRFFAPQYTFWLDTQGSHPCVKYRGALGSATAGLPMVIYELISYTQEPTEDQPEGELKSP